MSTELEQSVDAGIAYLEKQLPWLLWNVDLDTLAMEDDCHCMFGQGYGMYSTGVEELQLDTAEVIRLGFDVPFTVLYQKSLAELTPIWKEKVRQWRLDNQRTQVPVHH